MDPIMNFVMHFQHLLIYVVGAFLIIECSMMDKITMFSNMVVFSSWGMQVIISFLIINNKKTVYHMVIDRNVL